MANYDSSLTGAQIESALTAINGLIAASNNGKIICVDNGALAAKSAIDIQGGTIDAITITENGTYTHTTLGGYSPVTVNVSGGGQGTPYSGSTPPASSLGLEGNVYVQTINHGFLSSDGASYIDPNIVVNAECRIETEFAIVQTSTNYDTIFGCRNGSLGRFTARYGNTTSGALAVQISKTPSASYDTYTSGITKNASVGTFNKISLSRESWRENGLPVYNFGDTFTSASESDFPYGIYMFALNNAGSPYDYGYVSIKYLKCYNKYGTITKYLVATADEDNTPCMYDMVSGTYFYNQGTGAFTYSSADTRESKIVWQKISGVWTIVGEI